MKRKSVLGLICGLGIFAAGTIAGLVSCEVGLGSAVDVQTPELAITYPATGSIISDKFALSGTCSDDGKIKSITITIRSTEDNSSITRDYEVKYIDEVNHKWLCEIDPFDAKNPLIDGTYEATVEIEDNAKHKNSKSRSFTIDNTPPVIAITRPSAIAPLDNNSTDYDSYGQDFIISGHVGDACDSKYMIVTISNMAGDVLYTTPEKIKIDSDFSVTLASYSAEAGSNEKKAYDAIYGTDKEAGTKKFLCAITGYDAAETIPVDGSAPTDKDKVGNSITYFYMYEGDLYSDIFYPYGTSNAYKILSGTFGETEARAVGAVSVDAEAAKTLLKDPKYHIEQGFFSLNPRNNPSFIVSGRDPLALNGKDFVDNADFEISNGSKVVVEITPGLDATPISEDTLGLYVIECDNDGKIVNGAEKITIIPALKDEDGKVLLNGEEVIAKRKESISKSGSTYKLTTTFSLKNTPELEVEKTYLIGLYGCDIKKIPVKNLDTEYGFKFVSTGSAPELAIQNPKGSINYFKKGVPVSVSGWTKVNNAVPTIKIELVTKDDEGNETKKTIKEFKTAEDYGEGNVIDAGSSSSGVKKQAKFSYEIPASEFSQTESGQYEIKITASAGGNDTEAVKTIMYDVEDPVVSFLVQPQFDKYTGEDNTEIEKDNEGNAVPYINGTVKFKVSLSDNYSVYNADDGSVGCYLPIVEFIQNGVAVPNVISDNFKFTILANQEIEVDTTKLTNGQPVNIKVSCTDLAGNTASSEIVRYVDQSTDIPVIQGTNNSTIAYASKQALKDGKDAGSAKNIIVANSTFALNFIDDDGLKSLKVKSVDAFESDDESAKMTALEAKTWTDANISEGSTTTQYSEVLSTAGKYYFFKFLAEDIYGKTEEFGPIVVLVSAQNPVLTFVEGNSYVTTNTDNVSPERKTAFTSKLEIGSTSNPFKLFRQIVAKGADYNSNPAAWTEVSLADANSKDQTDSYTPTEDPGAYDICYMVKDSNNHDSNIVRNANVVIDNTPPILTITDPADNVKIGENAINESNYRFKGTFTEANIDTFYYQILNASAAAPSIPTTNWGSWSKGVSTEGTAWEFAAEFKKTVDEGSKKLYIYAVDKAGNVSETGEVTFDVDMTYPEITTKIDGVETKSTATISKTAAYTFKFKAEDTNGTSIISPTITVKKDDVALTTTSHATNPYYTLSTTADSDGFKTITISNSSDGIFEYAISATDAAGKNTTVERTINLDTHAPENTTFSPDLNEYQPDTTVNVSGTAQDQTGILTVWYAYDITSQPGIPDTAAKAKVDSNWTGSGWTKATGTTNWKINGLTGADGSPRKLYICLVDKNGLINDLGEKTVKVDTANPTLTETTINKTGIVYSNSNSGFTLSGKAEDANGIAEVKIEYTKNGGAKQTTTVTPNSSKVWTYKVNYAAAGANDGDYEYTITAIDKAGKASTQIQRHVIYDTVAPKAMHYADNSGKDIYFRFGDADNTLSEVNTWKSTITALDSALDYDVGGKYKFGSWGNDISIKIRGLFEETGSGVDTIYYAVCANETAVSDFIAAPETKKTGTFAPLAANETKRVKKNNASGYEFVEIESSYKTIISTGLQANKNNILVLVAKDKAGNTAADTMVIYDGTTTGNASWNGSGKNYYSINIDNKKPTVTSNFAETTLYTNGTNTIEIDGIAEDAAATGEVSAGLSSFSLEVNDVAIDSSYITLTKTGSATALDTTTTYSGLGAKKWYWKASIPGSVVKGSATSGNVTIKARIVDQAGVGNIATPDVAVVTIDTKAPTVEITPPQDADTSAADIQVNKTFTLEGKASDSNGLKEDTDSDKNLKLYYTTKTSVGNLSTAPTTITTDTNAANGWKEFATAKHNTNWSFSVNTNTIQSGTTATTAYFIVEAKDKAGNTGYSKPQKLVINQNTDRPIIKFTNITESNGSYFLKFGNQSQLEGNVSDDDKVSAGVVDTFIVSSTAVTSAPSNGNGGWTKTTDTTKGTTTWQHLVPLSFTWEDVKTEENATSTYYTNKACTTAATNQTADGTTVYKKAYDITTITNSSGDYIYTPADTGDGLKEVYFFVKDKAGTNFYTAATQLNQPYQQYKTNDKTGNTAMISYKSDSTSPTIKEIKIQPYTGSNVNGSTVDPGTGTVVGGPTKNKIKFIIKATDANGIKDMTLEYTPAGGTKQTITTETTGGTFTETTTSADATWTTPFIDIAALSTGSVSVAITANDQCGLFANQNPIFNVDNDGPVINITSPKSTDEITGKLTISGTTTDDGLAGAASIDFIVPTKAQRTAAGDTDSSKQTYYKGLADDAWGGHRNGDSTISAFRYDFNGDTTNDNALLDIYTKDDTSDPKIYDLPYNDNGIYTAVPIIFRSKDSLGNVSIKEYSIKYNPDGDKPKTDITYPSKTNYEAEDKPWVTLGGEIRVTGSVSIPSLTTTPERVYLQIADSRQAFDSTDKTKAGTGTGNYGYTIKTLTNVGSDIGKTIQGITGTAATNWWGIEAVRSSNAWSISLNSESKMNPTVVNTTNNIYIRACGVNAEGKMGSWSEPVCIHIDASAPQYTTKLYQFSSTPSVGSQTAEKDYEPGIYLKGQWYLGLHITDEDTVVIDSVKKGGTSGTPLPSSDLTEIKTNSNKTADLFIKLDANATSTQTYTVSARDNATGGYHWIYPSYDINIDNTPPELTDIVTGEGYPIHMTKQRTSNNVITFGATATDTGSGFSRLAYYFKRGTSIELPLPTAENENQKKWKVGSAYTGALTDTCDYLYGVELTGTGAISGENTTFTSSEVGTNTFIRKGGIVKLAGTYHKIENVTTNTVTVSGKIDSMVSADASDTKTAFFPAALIVDNTSAETSAWASGINTITGDDGDGVVESVKKAGATWTWDTSIYAGELDDGEVELVCVAFDVAENVAISKCPTPASTDPVKFMLTNKTPRLSKLYLATDLNGDGKYSDNELGTSVISASGSKTIEKYYSALDNGNLQDVFTVYGNETDTTNSETESGITMRDNLGIAFEFISGYEGYGTGHGDLKYKLSVAQDELNEAQTGTSLPSLATADDSNYDDTDDTVTKTLIGKKFLELTPEMFTGGTTYGEYREYLTSGETGYNSTTDYYLNYLRITLWDSSNDRAGTTDGTKTPKSYTNSNGDTASYDTYASFGAQWTAFNIPLYMDLVDGLKPTVTIANPVALGTEDVPQGHVDLKATLSSLTGSDEFDSDDKVSGMIKFTGSLNDDKRIDYINLTVNKNFSGKQVSGERLATYVPLTGGFKVGTNGAAVTIGGTSPTAIVPNSATGLTFKLLSNEFSTKDGHTVTWELEVDTELVASLAQTDVIFTVTANDGTNTTNTTHKVDIVPYISSFKRSTTLTDTHRSKKGKYQVVLGESVDITGWNLPGTTANAIKLQTTGNQATNTVKTQITAATGSDKNTMTFTVPGTSGYIKVVTNGVSSVNNFNSGNEIDGEYGSDDWNDDLYLSVWKNDEYFYFSNDPISPAMDKISNGKGQNRLYGGWGTQGSKVYASYPYTKASVNTAGNSGYKPDGTGNAPGPANGGGNALTCQGSSGFGDPITYYDVVVIDGTKYNLILDCWQGSTTGWGQSFNLNKNGYFHLNGNQNRYENMYGYNNNNNYVSQVVERMGRIGVGPDAADSSDGTDEIFNQFLNPRITVYNDKIYTSYYDRYAKCLKWAMVDPKDNDTGCDRKYSVDGIWNTTYTTDTNGTDRLSNGYTNGSFIVAGYDTLQNDGSKTNLDVGLWSSIAIDPSTTDAGKPIIAYYDSTARKLWIATSAGKANTASENVNLYPLNTNTPVLSGIQTSATNGQGDAWNRTEVKKTNADSQLRLGQYVSMVTDAGGNLHIACNGAKGGNKLYYIYGAKQSYGTYDFTLTCVDSEGAGTWTDIQLEAPTASGAAAKPVISYYDPSNDSSENAVKVAYLDGGEWDTMTAPLSSTAISNRITLALDVTDGVTYTDAGTSNNSKLAVGYVSSRFDCVYLRKE